jgi:hypothetical protein
MNNQDLIREMQFAPLERKLTGMPVVEPTILSSILDIPLERFQAIQREFKLGGTVNSPLRC